MQKNTSSLCLETKAEIKKCQTSALCTPDLVSVCQLWWVTNLHGYLLFCLASLATENRTILESNRGCVGEVIVSLMCAALATVNEPSKEVKEERGWSYKRNWLGCCRLLFSFTSEFL